MSISSPDNLNSLKPHLLKGDLSDEEIAFFVSKLQKGFTSNRENIGDYQKSAELVSAYTAFYMPSNFKKSVKTFEYLESVINLQTKNSVELYDIGCGPGTMSLAYAKELQQKFPGIELRVNLVDTSRLMLDQAEKLFSAFFPEVKVYSFLAHEFFNSSKFKRSELSICLFANSQNEFGQKVFLSYLEKVSPELICLLSPGNKDRFWSLLDLKDILESKKGYSIAYPCVCSEKKCPLDRGDWCHQVLRVKNDPSFDRISQMTKIDRRTLPYIFHLYQFREKVGERAPSLNLETLTGTILQFLGKNKACYRWRICLIDQDNGGLRDFNAEFLIRGMDKRAIKMLEELNVGDRVEIKIKKFINDSTIRIVIPGISIQN